MAESKPATPSVNPTVNQPEAASRAEVTYVTNNSNSELGLPGGMKIPKGETRPVKDWAKLESNDVIQAWISAKQITVSDSEPKAAKDDSKAKA